MPVGQEISYMANLTYCTYVCWTNQQYMYIIDVVPIV